MIPLPHYRKIAHMRLAELETLYRARWGATLPDDDAGIEDMEDALAHIAFMPNAMERMMAWCRKWAPWLPTGQARVLCERIVSDPPRFEADELGDRMRLDLLERMDLGIKTIGTVHMDKPTRERFRRLLDNAKRKAKRKKRKKVTVAERAKANGVSRATYYRHRKRETESAVSI